MLWAVRAEKLNIISLPDRKSASSGIRNCSNAKIGSKIVKENPKSITGYPERRCAGDTSLQQTKKKSDIRFWMSLCLLLTGHWYLPAGLCTVSQIEVSPLCSCTYSLICGYVAPFWNPDISIFSNENSTRTFFESISPLERRTTVSKKLVRSSPVGLGAI